MGANFCGTRMSSGTALLQAFRSASVLSSTETEYVSNMGVFCERPLPACFSSRSPEREGTALATPLPDGVDDLLSSGEEIENIQQFYNWIDNLQVTSGSKEENELQVYCQRLEMYNECSGSMLQNLENILGALDALTEQHKLVSTKTGELHHDCESLLLQQQNLDQFAKQLKSTLQYFNQMDDISQLLARPKVSVMDPKFTEALASLDDSISFISENPSFMESRLYLMKFRQLQTRGLTMIKTHIINSLRNTVLRNQEEELDTRAYIRFRTLASSLRPLCEEIEKRGRRREYQALLSDCHYCYFQQRYKLLSGSVQQNILNLQQLPDLTSMIRSGCAYLIRICQNEHELYRLFFSTFSTAMRNMLEGFGDMLYTALRPLFIRAQEIDLLCSAAHVLKTEILYTIQEKGESVQAFLGIINRILGDIQERLIYLSQKYILDQICTFYPTKEHLDYPARLQSSQKEASTNMYAHWYPTLEKTLTLLSRLYLSIDAKIFEGLAQETVSECCHSLRYAATRIEKEKGWVDGRLFLMQHLMILREQITPFDINFVVVQKELDLSHMRESFTSLFRGKFSWRQSSPRVVENHSDSKKALEKMLADTIEDFCARATSSILEDLSFFLTTASSFNRIHDTDGQVLREQNFATPDTIKKLVEKTFAQRGELAETTGKVRMYFASEQNYRYVIEQLQEFIFAEFKKLLRLLDTHYTEADRELIGISLPIVQRNFSSESPKPSPQAPVQVSQPEGNNPAEN